MRRLFVFNGYSVIVVNAWPTPFAWLKTRKDPWWRHAALAEGYSLLQPKELFMLVEHKGQLWLPFAGPERETLFRRVQAYAKWFNHVPEEILQYLRGFPEWPVPYSLPTCSCSASKRLFIRLKRWGNRGDQETVSCKEDGELNRYRVRFHPARHFFNVLTR